MNHRGMFYLLAFGALILTIGLACSTVAGAPTAMPVSTAVPVSTSAPVNTSTPQSSGATATAGSSSALVTFTDKNNYYQIDVPGDWTHSHGTATHLYWDDFTSPDSNALVENFAYDNGTVWTGATNGKAALLLLNNYYSFTKQEGDIRITNDSIQPDGSERLTWTSKGGGYSGVSYFEVRNRTTFLMLTMQWKNDKESTYIDTLNSIVASYKNPNP